MVQNRELLIGLIFLSLLAVIAGVLLTVAWVIQYRRKPVEPIAHEAPPEPKGWLAQDLQDLDTKAIPRSRVYKALREPVGGVEPSSRRTSSWPVRLRH